MSKIDYQIGEANFSIVTKRIGQILADEFAAQISLGNTFLPSVIYFDTNYAADEGNIPWIGINWLEFENNIDSRADSQNLNKYFIDVKAKGYDNFNKIISVIRTILKSQQYITLDFNLGLISDTNISGAGVNFEESMRDSQDVVSGGVSFQCMIVEPNDKPIPLELNDSEYQSEINESGKFITLQTNY